MKKIPSPSSFSQLCFKTLPVSLFAIFTPRKPQQRRDDRRRQALGQGCGTSSCPPQCHSGLGNTFSWFFRTIWSLKPEDTKLLLMICQKSKQPQSVLLLPSFLSAEENTVFLAVFTFNLNTTQRSLRQKTWLQLFSNKRAFCPSWEEHRTKKPVSQPNTANYRGKYSVLKENKFSSKRFPPPVWTEDTLICSS